MNFILKFFVRFIGVLLSLIIINKILTFFGFDISSYLIYMIWFIAIALFYFILPKNYELFN